MDEKAKKALESWRSLNELLHTLSEDQLQMMLDYEMLNDNRRTFVERLHQRYNTLRVMRERGEILESFNKE